jgi:putative membrane protein (TIGR04086 family)
VEQNRNKEIKENKAKKRLPFGWIYAGLILLAAGLAVGMFLLWTWIAYRVRFSAEVIRFGLLFLYFLPCLISGKILAKTRCPRPVLWGAGLGAICYIGLLVTSILVAIATEGTWTKPDWTAAIPLLLGASSGALGAFRPKKEA